jgi:hypothetical protein
VGRRFGALTEILAERRVLTPGLLARGALSATEIELAAEPPGPERVDRSGLF